MKIDYDNKGCLYILGVFLLVILATTNPIFAIAVAVCYFGAGALGGKSH